MNWTLELVFTIASFQIDDSDTFIAFASQQQKWMMEEGSTASGRDDDSSSKTTDSLSLPETSRLPRRLRPTLLGADQQWWVREDLPGKKGKWRKTEDFFRVEYSPLAQKKKLDELNRSATFLVDELEKHPEYAQIIHRELHDVRLGGANLALFYEDQIKNLPFVFERLQQIYYWSTQDHFGYQLERCYPALASENQMKIRHHSIWGERFLFQFECEINVTSDPSVITTDPDEKNLKVEGGLFYTDLIQAEKFYREHSVAKDHPFAEPICCHIDCCVWTSTQFRYALPIFSMKGREGLVHCSKCNSFAHILCTYYLFLRKMIEFQTCVPRSCDEFKACPSVLSVFQYLQFCLNCGVILCNENRLKLTGSIAFLYLFGLNCDFEFSLKYRQIEDYFDQARVTFERPPQVNIPFSDPIRSSKITHEVFRVLYHDMIRHYIGEDLAKISKQKLRPTFSEWCTSIIEVCKTLVSREDFPKMFQQFIDWKKIDKDEVDD